MSDEIRSTSRYRLILVVAAAVMLAAPVAEVTKNWYPKTDAAVDTLPASPDWLASGVASHDGSRAPIGGHGRWHESWAGNDRALGALERKAG